ncbi:hypothetical protein GCM10023194_54320 [Planotetraspora phitsanulokensis]|uniref:Uncharacterized protein n=1 Tax=Planotetraspora phitsanulokensis TaxID=575192 RepID=A0A8J3U1V3_9ACTN|nr:hypothetical protein [Planotetraspora phitsanulokensis]GII36686.1 hypothetical protein Pph01_16890 [Planotetraspora phitsanulokensis]
MSREEQPDTTGSWVVELIPGEEALVFLDADDLPDEDTVSELRMQAYARQDDPTLGPGETADVLRTLAEYAASGVVGAAAVTPFTATLRYLQRWRGKRRDNRIDIDRAIELARGLCHTALGVDSTACTVTAATSDDGGWRVRLAAAGVPVEVFVDASGTLASYRVVESLT